MAGKPVTNLNKEGMREKNEKTVAKIENESQSLNENKDRAQAAAMWAMSIIHVTLFKAVIDQREEARAGKYLYFYPSVVLIGVALCLQVIVGILALIVANANRFFEKFNQKSERDNRCTCCGAIVNMCSSWENNVHGFDNVQDIMRGYKKSSKSTNPFKIIDEIEIIQNARIYKQITNKPEIDIPIAQIPDFLDQHYKTKYSKCCFGRPALPEYADCIEGWQNIVTYVNTRYKVRIGSYKTNIDIVNHENKLFSKQIEHKSTERDKATNKEIKNNLNAEIATLKNKESESVKKLSELEWKLKRAELKQNNLEGYGLIIENGLKEVRKERVFKYIDRIQNIMKYILYTVFVINAFIAGLGIAEPINITNNNVTQ